MKVCGLIFTTSRYEYLIPTLKSMRENVDFSGLDVHWILIDDYPQRRDVDVLNMIVDIFSIDKLVMNEKNLGYSASWAKAWTMIPDDTDYIWHQEDDFIFTDTVSVTDMIKTFEVSPKKLSQLFLKRNSCYSSNDFVDLIHDGKLGEEIESNDHTIVAFRHHWFIPHPGIYPYWISQEEYPYNPQEGTIANYLHCKYPDIYSAAMGDRQSSHRVQHIGEYNQGQKCLPGEPGWDRFGKYDPDKQYVSLAWLTEYQHSHNYTIGELCEKYGYWDLANRYYDKSVNTDTDDNDKRYLAALRIAVLCGGDKAISYYSKAVIIQPERLEAWYHLMIHHKNVNWHVAYGYGRQGYESSYLDHRGDNFINKATDIYTGRFILELSMVAYYSQHHQEAANISKKFDYQNADAQVRRLHAANLKFYNKLTYNHHSPSVTSVSRSPDSGPAAYPTPSVVIIDNFLPDPEQERDYALGQDFNVLGNYPGKRTESFATEQDKELLEQVLNHKITYWPGGYNGCYQICTGNMKSWIHRDNTTHSAILFLTPDAPCQCGTTIYNHIETGKTYGESKEITAIMDKDSNDESKWQACDVIGNRFNRLIIFGGKQYHRSSDYFGSDASTGRLFKIFFFNVE